MRIFGLVFIALVLQVSPIFAITLAGTGDSQIMLQRLAGEYQHLFPEREVRVPPSVGSSGGIRLLLQGRVDLARVARPLSDAETEKGLHYREFASVPIVFVANLPSRCVTNISSQQLVGIFNGRYGRWSQLGNCPDKKIYLARREAGDSSNRILYEKIPGLSAIKRKAGKTVHTTQEAYNAIAAYPYTLGYLPLSQVTDSSLTRLSLDGVPATQARLIDQSYPLRLGLALVWQDPLAEEAREFLQFLGSPKAREVISTFGARPLF